MSSEDVFGISAVSGFYGPGAWLSWILIIASCLVDHAFAGNRLREDKAAHILGIDLNVVSATAYPLIAAVNFLTHMPSVVLGTFPPDAVARISAPLLVLRLFRVFGLLLLGVTCKSRRPWRPGGWRLNRAIFLVLSFVLVGDGMVFTGVNRERWTLGLESRLERGLRIVFEAMMITLLFGSAAKRPGPELLYQQAAFSLTLLAWLLSFCAETAFDMAYGRALWSCYRKESCNRGMHLVMMFPTLNQTSNRGDFEEVIPRHEAYLHGILDKLRSSYEETGRFGGDWRLVERTAGLLWLLEARPETYYYACKSGELWCMVISTAFMIYFWALEGWCWIGKSKGSSKLLTKQRRFGAAVEVVWFATLQPMWLLSLLQPIDLALRVVAIVTRPGRFLPGTTAGFMDLDQMAALMLNGAIPLIYSIWRAVYASHRLRATGLKLVTLWGRDNREVSNLHRELP